MRKGSEEESDMLWRLAPWLTVAAMTMTVLSQAPAAPQDSGGHGCAGHGHGAHDAALNNREVPRTLQRAG